MQSTIRNSEKTVVKISGEKWKTKQNKKTTKNRDKEPKGVLLKFWNIRNILRVGSFQRFESYFVKYKIFFKVFALQNTKKVLLPKL